MSEATPEVLTPMCWSIWTPLGELGARRAWYELGLLPRSDVYLPKDPNEYALGTFYGRQALNVDRLATMMGALPGASRESVERSMLGTVRDCAPSDRAPTGRLPFVLTRAPAVFAAQGVRARRSYADQLAWWQRDVLDGAETDGQALLAAARDRFVHAVGVHGLSRFQSQAVIGAIEKLAADAGVEGLVTTACSAFGQVSETGIAADLWDLSRARLSEEQFLRRHGYHGSAEGNVTGVSWRMDAGAIRSVAKSMADRPESDHPLRHVAAAAEARTAAVRTMHGRRRYGRCTRPCPGPGARCCPRCCVWPRAGRDARSRPRPRSPWPSTGPGRPWRSSGPDSPRRATCTPPATRCT
jgi:pyruvate,water dikinase